MAQWNMALDLNSAKKLLGRVEDIKCYFVRMKSIPQSSTFTGLATTLQYEDEYAAEIPLLQLFSVTEEVRGGSMRLNHPEHTTTHTATDYHTLPCPLP